MWYEKAAERGNAWAQFRCGDMYYNGEGTEADKTKARMWYEEVGRRSVLGRHSITQFHYDELQKELDYCRTTRTAEVKSDLYYRIEKMEKILQQAHIVVNQHFNPICGGEISAKI